MHKVLLDENLPVKIKYRLQDTCEVYTVTDKGWNALENGALIKAMEEQDFEYLITSDKNLQFQQHINKCAIGFIVLDVLDNNYESILPLVEKIKMVLIENSLIKLSIVS